MSTTFFPEQSTHLEAFILAAEYFANEGCKALLKWWVL
jgi:hypothetical protein